MDVSDPNEARFLHSERELAVALGVSTKTLRETRAAHLQRGDHWTLIKNEVRYTEAARGLVLARLGLTAELRVNADHSAPNSSAVLLGVAPLTGSAAAEGTRIAGTIEDLVCHKCYHPNIRMLEAKSSSGEIVLVRVRDNRNLRTGMVMKCKFAGGRIFELAQRLPRFRGKW